MESVRLDKYLWAIRVYKTRTDATDACKGGKVRINGLDVKPSKEVKVGDVLTIRKGAVVKHCIIAENVTVGENAVVGAMPTEEEKGVATIGANVNVGAGAKIGPNAMVRNDVKDGEEQW